MLRRLGVQALPIRTAEGLSQIDGLIIPGGESTTIGKLAARWGLIEPLHRFIEAGKPVWGTCAGMIFMAKDIGQTPEIGGAHIIPPRLPVLDIKVDRNAFGRQVDSFEAELPMTYWNDDTPFPAVFIRAPRIEAVGDGVVSLITFDSEAVAVLQDNQLMATTFHPELTGDDRLHRFFLLLIKS